MEDVTFAAGVGGNEYISEFMDQLPKILGVLLGKERDWAGTHIDFASAKMVEGSAG